MESVWIAVLATLLIVSALLNYHLFKVNDGINHNMQVVLLILIRKLRRYEPDLDAEDLFREVREFNGVDTR